MKMDFSNGFAELLKIVLPEECYELSHGIVKADTVSGPYTRKSS